MSGNDRLKCSFCGKTHEQVKKLIAGPDVCICDECIDALFETKETYLEDETSTDTAKETKKKVES